MKILNAIAIIALCAQGFFLHADAAYNKLRLRRSGGEPSNTDNVRYRGGPSNTETVLAQRLARRDDKKAQSTDNVGYGGESGVGAYLQTQVASRHGGDSLDSYDKCDSKLKATCCGLYGMPEQYRKDVCYAVGCNYNDCDWSDDGWNWAADGWQKECLQLESLYQPDRNGVIYADVVLDRNILAEHVCLESNGVSKVEGNVEIGPSEYLRKIDLNGLHVVTGSLALLGVIDDGYENNARRDATSPTFQADCLEEVHEFLQIRYNDFTNLELPGLTFVGRTLELKDNPQLRDFDFPVLRNIGLHLIVQDNPYINRIYLPSLERIRWDLWIQYCPNLEVIDTPKLTYIGEDYELHYCGSLLTIRHPLLAWIGEDFEVYSLLSLTELYLPRLEYIGEDFEVDNAPRLEVINLPQVRRMDEDMTLSSLPNLANLHMPSLEEVGEDFEFIMVGLPKLYLPALHTIESDTLLTELPRLKSIELPNIMIMEGALELNGCHLLEEFGRFLSLESIIH